MAQQRPDDFTPQDLTVYGEALSDFGLAQIDAIAGIGLLTRGLVWPCPQIWFDGAPSITSTWNNSSGPTLSTWTASSGTSLTAWTNEPTTTPWAEC